MAAEAASAEFSDGFESAVAFATPLLTLAPSNLEERVLRPLRALLVGDIGAASRALKATDHVAPADWAEQES